MLLKLGALLLLAAMANGEAVGVYPYHSTQERPNGQENVPGCYISTLETVIPFDQVSYPEDKSRCAKFTCESETWNAYEFSCSYIHDRKKKGCKVIEGDKSERYPACCDRQVCDNE